MLQWLKIGVPDWERVHTESNKPQVSAEIISWDVKYHI